MSFEQWLAETPNTEERRVSFKLWKSGAFHCDIAITGKNGSSIGTSALGTTAQEAFEYAGGYIGLWERS